MTSTTGKNENKITVTLSRNEIIALQTSNMLWGAYLQNTQEKVVEVFTSKKNGSLRLSKRASNVYSRV
jgi:hypothetical protein